MFLIKIMAQKQQKKKKKNQEEVSVKPCGRVDEMNGSYNIRVSWLMAHGSMALLFTVFKMVIIEYMQNKHKIESHWIVPDAINANTSN